MSYLPKVPALPENNARQGFFEQADFEAVAAHLSPPLDDTARFAYGHGMAPGRNHRAPVGERGSLESRGWIPTSKSGEPRSVPLDDALWQIIERRWAAREYEWRPGDSALSAFVFHRRGRPLGNFSKVWKAACKKAGVPGKLFHDLRRTAVRDMIRAGVPQAVAKKISGHETDSIFERYNIVSEEDKLDALKRRRSYLESRESKRNVVPLAGVSLNGLSDKLSDRRANRGGFVGDFARFVRVRPPFPAPDKLLSYKSLDASLIL